MAETFITQCPHCGTSFRVKDDQLAVANGSVRCGACLQVFSARNHVVTARPAVKAGDAGAPETKTIKQPTKPERRAQPDDRLAESAVRQTPSAFEADQDDDADFLFADDPEEDNEFIFQDSDDDLNDRREDDNELGEFSDSFLNLNAREPEQRRPDPFSRETESLHPELFEEEDSPDESWAESILDELEREEQDNRKPEPPRFEPKAPTPPKRRRDSNRNRSDEPLDEELSAPGSKQASHLVRQLNHEIDLDFNVEERLARWRWLGGVFAVVLLIALGAQLAWLQKDTYAKMDQWRGLYASACDVLGCSLPAQVDLDQVRTSNVLVRDHKVLDNVNLLDAVLINRAPFKQPFPTLILQYTDVNGELVADQAFSPEDYLRGEMTGAELMPMNTRVYVSIPILDPGSRAVNYQLSLSGS